MNILIILNDAPYGPEKAYNALRLVITLQKEHRDVALRLFLLADAVFCALSGQETPEGYYNIQRMLRAVIARGGEVRVCGTCARARGLKALPLLEGVEIGTMSLLSQWTLEAEKVLVF